MTLLDVLQKINSDQLKSAQLSDMAVGTVTSTDPLEIQLDVHQAALRDSALVLTDAVRAGGSGSYFTDVNGELCVVWGGQGNGSSTLTQGEKVLLLSVQHGQTYIVLSRI